MAMTTGAKNEALLCKLCTAIVKVDAMTECAAGGGPTRSHSTSGPSTKKIPPLPRSEVLHSSLAWGCAPPEAATIDTGVLPSGAAFVWAWVSATDTLSRRGVVTRTEAKASTLSLFTETTLQSDVLTKHSLP